MSNPDTAPLAHTVPDACKRLGIGRTTLYELIATGKIRSFKVGNRTLIPESELRQFVADRVNEAA